MDVSNTTGEETKYRVTSGGTPPGDKEDDEKKSAKVDGEKGDKARKDPFCVTPWRKLAKSGCDKHAPVPPSPWVVEFQVGGKTVVGVASKPTDEVKLVLVKGQYKVEVSKPAKPVKPPVKPVRPVKPPKPAKPTSKPRPKSKSAS
jgi:hypothetical protein